MEGRNLLLWESEEMIVEGEHQRRDLIIVAMA